MTEHERVVRERWESLEKDNIHGVSLGGTHRTAVRICRDWREAYDFTLARLEEVRQIEREIEWVSDSIFSWEEMVNSRCPHDGEGMRSNTVGYRILSRLKAAHEELKKGMKG